MMHEAQVWELPDGSNPRAWFVTLTYDDEHLPRYGSLDPSDFTAFVKAVRKGEKTLSYFGCGEYGDQASRPHYHALLFGPEFRDRCALSGRPGPTVWESETLSSYWKRGICELSSVTFGSASYVAGYVRKKVLVQENPNYYLRVDDETGELVDVVPEFARMSRRPAIGRRWIEKHWREVYAHDRVVMDGVEQKPPRYYDKWMETDHGGDCPCDEHRELLLQVKYNRWVDDYDDSKYKQNARRVNHEARVSLYQQRKAF